MAFKAVSSARERKLLTQLCAIDIVSFEPEPQSEAAGTHDSRQRLETRILVPSLPTRHSRLGRPEPISEFLLRDGRRTAHPSNDFPSGCSVERRVYQMHTCDTTIAMNT